MANEIQYEFVLKHTSEFKYYLSIFLFETKQNKDHDLFRGGVGGLNQSTNTYTECMHKMIRPIQLSQAECSGKIPVLERPSVTKIQFLNTHTSLKSKALRFPSPASFGFVTCTEKLSFCSFRIPIRTYPRRKPKVDAPAQPQQQSRCKQLEKSGVLQGSRQPRHVLSPLYIIIHCPNLNTCITRSDKRIITFLSRVYIIESSRPLKKKSQVRKNRLSSGGGKERGEVTVWQCNYASGVWKKQPRQRLERDLLRFDF